MAAKLDIGKDTQLCASFAGNPSNMGTRFHNYLYHALELDFVYKAFSPGDITGAVTAVRALPLRGAAVSMPFKEAVIPLLDELAPSAAGIGAVNTIVNDDGHLTGHNTDLTAVRTLVRDEVAPNADPCSLVALRGNGGMAKAALAGFIAEGFTDIALLARDEAAGRRLAAEFGDDGPGSGRRRVRWMSEEECLRAAPSVLVNVTPLGMDGKFADELSFPRPVVEDADVVFDVVAFPPATPLAKLARKLGKAVVTGDAVHALQAVEQFELYTGVRPGGELVAAARTHALQS